MVTGSTKRDGSNGTVDKNAGQRNPTSVQMPNDRRMNGNTHEHEHKRHDNDRKIFHHVHLPERAWPAPQNFTMTIKVKLADILRQALSLHLPPRSTTSTTTWNRLSPTLHYPTPVVSSLPSPVNTPISQPKVLSLFSLQNSLSCPCSHSHSCSFSSQLMTEGREKGKED